jgi:hypothetical protein
VSSGKASNLQSRYIRLKTRIYRTLPSIVHHSKIPRRVMRVMIISSNIFKNKSVKPAEISCQTTLIYAKKIL